MKALEIKNVSISYQNVITPLALRALNKDKNKLSSSKITIDAVKKVSFDVEEGDIVGLIGRNGSGKSTLLRAIAGILQPNSGSINSFEKSISLLALGVGFKSALSGRENIMLSGLLMGFSEKEIKRRIDDVIEFSELGSFIDMPVRTYSSGMYSKLAFSITAVFETDILLIDEVLSVGDEAFKAKSLARMHALINQTNRTVVIVSHSLSTIRELCNKVVWLHNGEVKSFGQKDAIIAGYQAYNTELKQHGNKT